MSFILDALKKSENERARQAGPVLLEARVVRPRRGVPAWAIAVTLVLLANLAVLAVVLLRQPAPAPAPAPAPVVQPQVPQPVPPAAAPAAATTPAAPPTAPLAQAPWVAAPTAAAATQDYAPPAPPPVAQAPAPSSRVQVMPAPAIVNPADYEPARPPPATPAGDAFEDARLPTATDLRATGAQLPELRLALIAYADDPSIRYALLNSQRMQEGDTSREGLRLERITERWLVLEWRGRRFRLQPGE